MNRRRDFLTAVAGLEDGIYLKWIMTGLLLLVLFYTVLGKAAFYPVFPGKNDFRKFPFRSVDTRSHARYAVLC